MKVGNAWLWHERQKWQHLQRLLYCFNASAKTMHRLCRRCRVVLLPCCRLQQNTVLGETRPGQTRLILSHGAVSTGSLGLSQSRWSQCILHEVLNEYKNTQIHKAENECNLNAKPLCCGQTWATTLEEDVCSVPASLNPTAQSLQLAHKVEKEQKKVRRWNEMQLEREKLCR